jgi:protein-glutamine gamma-glutamyltransferase
MRLPWLFPGVRGAMASPSNDALPAGRSAILTLLLALIPVLAPHTNHLPVWCSAFAGLLFLWRAWLTWRETKVPLKLPPRWLMMLMMLAGIALTLYTHRTLFGRDAGVTFVTVMLALKLLETRSKRDAVVAIFLSYFLILTNFFYSQSVGTAALMLVALTLITSALIATQRDAQSMPLVNQTRLAAIIIAQAFPMMLVLFIAFPRVQGPLWGLPADAHAGTSGLSDSMSPGNISQLILSDAIAFRVDFQGPAPRADQLYWRGPVLSAFDGRNWRAQIANPLRPARFVPQGEPLNYTVTMEPSGKPWIFALEMPTLLPSGARLLGDLQPVSERAITQRLRYQATSHLDFRMEAFEDREDLRPYLALPRNNPRTREMVAGWVYSEPNPERIVARALALFREEQFVYTLEPPLLDNNAVDEFLFIHRRGFCEHYASAFTLMMRAAGIPARVVTGYLGGEVNPVDKVFTVRQSDAHAWTEIWLRGRGWTRVDPTAAVSPLRVERGLPAVMPQRFATPLFARVAPGWSANLLAKARFNWEAFNNTWNQFVLNYSPDRQRETLERLGMKSPTLAEMVIAMVIGAFLVSLVITAFVLKRARESDPVQRAWLKFCARLKRLGVLRAPHEGPLDFAARARTQLPNAPVINHIAEAYARLRYGPKPDKVAVGQFARMVREARL